MIISLNLYFALSTIIIVNVVDKTVSETPCF